MGVASMYYNYCQGGLLPDEWQFQISAKVMQILPYAII
jgi:hypothetical protein